MIISKSSLLQLCQDIRKTGNYPLHLTDLFTTLEKCEYSKPFTYLTEIENHVKKLGENIDLQAALPVWTNDNNAYWGASVALCAELCKSLISKNTFVKEQKTIDKNYKISKPTVIQGDLVVNGNLNLEYIDGNSIGLIVLGDLHLTGNYHTDGGCLVVLGDLKIDKGFDEKSDWSLTVVGGQCTAQNFINSCGELYVFGKVLSPYIFVSYNHGRCVFNHGFDTLYFHESDHGSSVVKGSYSAEFIAYDEIEGVGIADELKNYQQLTAIIASTALGKLKKIDWSKYDEDEYGSPAMYLGDEYDFDTNDFSFELLEELRKGKVIFELGVLNEWRKKNL